MVEESFLFFFPLLRFLPRPSGFGPVLQWFDPIKEAVPLLATSKFFEAGPTALLSFQISRVFSLPSPSEKHLRFPIPLSFLLHKDLTILTSPNLRVLSPWQIDISS
jgi:hypothetical protein